MSNIDDKLREILGGDTPSGSTQWAIAQIKQLFEEYYGNS